MLPFRDEAACAARAIAKADIGRREPSHHPQSTIRAIEAPEAFYDALADDILGRMLAAVEAGRPFVGLFPVGPVGRYERLVEEVLNRGVTLDHCHLFFLDEYADEDGRTVDKQSPWSFEFVAHRQLLHHVWQAGLDPARVCFPGPDNIARYDELVLEASQGRGADVVYGGVGWCGHFAFWEPHLRDEFASEGEWRQAHSAFVRLHPMGVLHNSLRAGGAGLRSHHVPAQSGRDSCLALSGGASGWTPTWDRR